MEQYVIYDHPSDFPQYFVLKRFKIGNATVTQDRNFSRMSTNVEHLRRIVRDLGLTMVARDPQDDPVILEVWI